MSCCRCVWEDCGRCRRLAGDRRAGRRQDSVTTQRDLIESSRSRYAQLQVDVVRLVGRLSGPQLAWAPPDGGWSVAQVLEHLTVVNEQYLREIHARLDHDPPMRRSADTEWRPSLAGRLLAHAMVNPRKMKSPRGWRPGSVVRDRPLESFTRTLGELSAGLDRADEVDLRRARTRSPASRLIWLNLGDAFELQALHAERHLGQIRRIMSRPEFPG